MTPKKIDDTKRQRLSWNMMDNVQDRSNSNCILVSDDIKDGTSGNIPPGLLTFEERKIDEIKYELKLNDSEATENSFGLLGSFSGAYVRQGPLQQAQVKDEFSNSGIVVKLCKAGKEIEVASRKCDISPRSNQYTSGETNWSALVQVNASSEQINALGYLQSKDLVSVLCDLESPKIPTHDVNLLVYLNNNAISKVASPNEDPCLKKADKMTKVLMAWFHDICDSLHENECPRSHGCDDKLESLFDALKMKRDCSRTKNLHLSDNSHGKVISTCSSCTNKDEDLDKLQHACLVPSLRNYQKKSVRWMINKEQLNSKLTAEGMQNIKIIFYNMQLCLVYSKSFLKCA